MSNHFSSLSPDRITYAEANEMLYFDSEYGRTQVETLGSDVDILGMVDYMSENPDIGDMNPDQAKDFIYSESGVEDADYKAVSLEHAFHKLATITEIVSNSTNQQEADLPPNQWIDSVFTEFKSETDLVNEELDIEDYDISQLVAFIDYYDMKCREFLAENDIPLVVQEARADMLDIQDSTALRRQLGVSMGAVAEILENTPIIIADPIMSNLTSGRPESETWGYFNNGRRVNVDPFSIAAGIEDIEKLELQLKIVTMHELTHSFSGTAYVDYKQRESKQPGELEADIDSHDTVMFRNYFPEFFIEGMTQKIAMLFFAISQREIYGHHSDYLSRGVDRESYRRNAFFDADQHVLAPKYVHSLSDRVQNSYFGYRMVVDTMFSKIDWSRVGLTFRQAEQMAVRAFLEPATAGLSNRSDERKIFNKTMAEATHPGFFVKVGKLVDNLSPNAAVDVLEDESVDLTNPKSIPNIAPIRKFNRLKRAGAGLDQAQVNLQMKKQFGSPESIKDASEYVKYYEQQVQEYEQLILAQNGLRVAIAAKHGWRRRYLTEAELFRAGLFGKPPDLPENNKIDPRDMTEQEYKAYKSVAKDKPSWPEYQPVEQ